MAPFRFEPQRRRVCPGAFDPAALLCRTRFPQHRTQGDHGDQLPSATAHIGLVGRRAAHAILDQRTAEPRRRAQPRAERPGRRSALAGESRARRDPPVGLAERNARADGAAGSACDLPRGQRHGHRSGERRGASAGRRPADALDGDHPRRRRAAPAATGHHRDPRQHDRRSLASRLPPQRGRSDAQDADAAGGRLYVPVPRSTRQRGASLEDRRVGVRGLRGRAGPAARRDLCRHF